MVTTSCVATGPNVVKLCLCSTQLSMNLSLLELGTNLPRQSPGEVLSFLAFHQ